MSNDTYFRQAQSVLAGGVNSPVRAFKSVGGSPIFVRAAQGACLEDVEGKTYLDYCQSWGASILGHAHPQVVRALNRQIAKGTSFGTCTPYETELAKQIRFLAPHCERLRFTSSGTEAVMSAVRLARAATGKPRLIKFEGCYHGHSDSLLVKAGSGLATFGYPSSAGVLKEVAGKTTVLPYNDPERVLGAFRRFRDIAAVIVEPIAGNMGVILSDRRFLQALRRVTRRHRALLIFDEVISGFRVGPRGAAGVYGITPDISVFGKIIGGGLPVGGFGSRRSIMRLLAPEGPVYQAGTLSGNPLAMVAGSATLRTLRTRGFYGGLQRKTRRLVAGMGDIFKSKGIPASLPVCGSMFSIFFQSPSPRSFDQISVEHVRRYGSFFHHMLDSGIYIPPSAYEAMFVTASHQADHIDKTLQAVRRWRV